MKQKRQEKILDLIQNMEIETQEELAGLLGKEGFSVTQATVSRDIRELKLTKSDGGRGFFIYRGKDEDEALRKKYGRILKEGALSLEEAQNILVVKTVSGMAMAVAAALDELRFSEIVGCIAGDDTIMCATKSAEAARTAKKKITELL